MISVIIPAYNCADTISKALNSVKNQTYEGRVEIIVVNDGSTDNTSEVVKDYHNANPDLLLKFINQKNGGVSKARNAGLAIAEGEYIALLDSDDEWVDSKLVVQMDYLLNQDLNIEFLGSARNNEVLFLRGKKIDSLYKVSPKDLLIKMFPQTSTAIFNVNLFKKYGGYNINMSHAEDGELWMRYCANSNFYFIPDSLVKTGEGKPNFGHSGLSADLAKMYLGNLNILTIAKKNKVISQNEYFILRIFYYLKHIRRIIITNLR